MFDGYLKLGENEIVNSSRAKEYGESAECPVTWFDCECDGLADALLQSGPYSITDITTAPWYDPRNPESALFYGVMGLGMKNVSDSTRYAEFTEGITDGGIAGSPRRAGRQVRVRVWLSATGETALEYGMTWLTAALESRRCDQHGDTCGGASMQFFVACPEPRGMVEVDGGLPRPETDAEYLPGVVAKQRFLHGVSVISGPLEIQTVRRGESWGREVEFTLYAEQPGVYAAPRDFGVLESIGEVIDDVVRNLVEYPSAELFASQTVVAYNHVTNPSLELNATNWSGGGIGGDDTPGSPAIGATSAGIVKGARSYAGESSFLTRWLGDGKTTGSGGRLFVVDMEQRSMPGIAAGDIVTVSIWAALVVQAGTPLQPTETLSAYYVWIKADGSHVGTWVSLGSTTGDDRSGRVFSLGNVVVPATATGILLEVRGTGPLVAYSSPDPAINRDIRLYADAAGVIEEV